MQRLAGAVGAVLLAGVIGSVGVQNLASAQTTAYVTDELEITLRSGQGNDYRIVRLLRSGSELEVLERSETWTRVRAFGDEGWVRNVYLQSEPGAAEQLAAATEEAAALRQENRELSEALDDAKTRLEELRATRAELDEVNTRMRQRLQEAGEGLELADENQALRKEVVDLERQVQDLGRENERITDRGRRDWFIAGAGVIVAGMLLGIGLTRIRWRRRGGSWGDL
ncbi:SH3 type 3 domain-containing protein [Spiribacter salinus M19-40]|uniref:SH3 type 3 domain-containing protein n=1 Tax=Spiribacter salinus M19-40 TaxID=1260251 RepID=R4VQM8_9GAMM|nr:TIGR04211 family SH3 domain-containing protein [Spiribacter salinus]AGM41733.1 SH3 type 3 domain-containing protein [Spiribacter salinus M19-40]MBY5268717.1 hypothetical protein [Spiribacter salinus]